MKKSKEERIRQIKLNHINTAYLGSEIVPSIEDFEASGREYPNLVSVLINGILNEPDGDEDHY